GLALGLKNTLLSTVTFLRLSNKPNHWVKQASLAQYRSQTRINGECFQDSPSKTLEENLF
ncbi:hypothetical protein SK128_014113, partial [Halocaridina rubra]